MSPTIKTTELQAPGSRLSALSLSPSLSFFFSFFFYALCVSWSNQGHAGATPRPNAEAVRRTLCTYPKPLPSSFSPPSASFLCCLPLVWDRQRLENDISLSLSLSLSLSRSLSQQQQHQQQQRRYLIKETSSTLSNLIPPGFITPIMNTYLHTGHGSNGLLLQSHKALRRTHCVPSARMPREL